MDYVQGLQRVAVDCFLLLAAKGFLHMGNQIGRPTQINASPETQTCYFPIHFIVRAHTVQSTKTSHVLYFPFFLVCFLSVTIELMFYLKIETFWCMGMSEIKGRSNVASFRGLLVRKLGIPSTRNRGNVNLNIFMLCLLSSQVYESDL